MRILVPTAVAALLVTSALSSCSGTDGGAGDEPGSTRYTVREELRIDGYEHELVPIDTTIRVAVGEDGVIAIAQRQSYDIRFFSETGEPLGRIGREGEGPAEFMMVHRLGWMGDTLYAYDFSLRRFTLFDENREYVRYIHVPVAARPGPELAGRFPEFQVVYGGALYADGSVYGQFAGPMNPGLGDHDPDQVTYGRVAEDGTIISYFQWSAGTTGDPVEVAVDEGTVLISPNVVPSPERPILRLNDQGTRMAHLVVSMEGPDAGTFELEMEDVFNGVLYTRRYPFDPIPITDAMEDSILESYFEGAPPEFARAVEGRATFPPLLPPVIGMVGGRDDSLWIRMRDTAEGRPYRILDPEGNPMGTLTLPTNQRIAVADLQNIWVIEEDELGVESVVRYAIVPERDST